MSRTLHRHLQGVGTPESVMKAFNAVEATFNPIWLNQTSGVARLQRVWRRDDHLANLELYSLGQGILSLHEHGHSAWLKKTARAIRDSPKQGHGLVTEIIIHATLRLGGQAFTPGPAKQQGYDLSTISPGGDEYLVSVKNHDATDASKAFQQGGFRVRKAWRDRLSLAKRHLGLTVSASQPMNEADFEDVIRHIKGSEAFGQEMTELAPHLVVRAAPLPYSAGELASNPVSDMVFLMAPASDREQTRFRANLQSAAQSFRKVKCRPHQWRIVHMRVHAMADMMFLEQLANSLLEDTELGIDAIHFHQPTYARDANNASLIHHAFKIAVSPRFAMNRADQLAITMALPVGSVGLEPSRLVMMQDGEHRAEISPNTYVFQRGDIYHPFRLEEGAVFSLGSPASGIREHLASPSSILSSRHSRR